MRKITCMMVATIIALFGLETVQAAEYTYVPLDYPERPTPIW